MTRTTRRGPVPPRESTEHEDTALEHAELCIRIMERFFDAADEHPNLQGIDVYDDLWPLYADVLQEELGPYAFDLAYNLFSEKRCREEVATRQRSAALLRIKFHCGLSRRLMTVAAQSVSVKYIYALESPYTDPPQPPLMADRLTTEQRRARRVKEQVPIFVCMGNPPYYREEGNEKERGKWVRNGDPNVPGEDPILEDFLRPAREANAGVHLKNIYNLYVYFWRWTLWKMFENPRASGSGIVSFITASSYLRGPGFAGMRQKMREAFDELWIIDLEGDNLGARRTENVFDIQTPVCIAIGIREKAAKRNVLAVTRYTRLMGQRVEKYARLSKIGSFGDVKWRECFDGPQDPIWPIPPDSWSQSPLLTDLWPWQHSGVQWKRTWPIGETREVLVERWRALVSANPDERAKLFKETRDRKVNFQYSTLGSGRQRLLSIKALSSNAEAPVIERLGFRSLDRRWVLLDNRLGDFLRPALWESSSDDQVFMTSLLTGVLGEGPSATVSAFPPDLHHFRGSFGGKDVIPLWRDGAARQPNLPAGLLDTLRVSLGFSVTPEDFFTYTYAVLSAPKYSLQFWEELTVPGPRVPLTREGTIFSRAVALGRRLLWLHTYGERFVPDGAPRGQLPGGIARCVHGISTSPDKYPEDVSFAGECLQVGDGKFQPVSDDVWKFSVSGFPVVESWIRSRLRERTGRRSSSLDDIRPAIWSATMTQELLELLWVVESTVVIQPELNRVLADILAGELFTTSDLPQPSAADRRPPSVENDDENDDDSQTELSLK